MIKRACRSTVWSAVIVLLAAGALLPQEAMAQNTFASPDVAAAAEAPAVAATLAATDGIDRAILVGDAEGFAAALAHDVIVNNPVNSVARRDAVLANFRGWRGRDTRSDEQSQDVDACKLVDASEIEAALGRAPAPHMAAMGPEVDEDSGARTWSCWRPLGDGMLFVIVAEFDTPAAAARAFATVGQIDDLDMKVTLTPQSGVGDRAAWAADPDAGIWMGAQKGRYVLGITLAAETMGEDGAGRYKEPLKRLVISGLAKL